MNHKSRIAALAIAAAGLPGCATMSSPEKQAKLQQFQETIPICEGEADCKAKWEAAQLWVVHNSRYKIQTATDVVIHTYTPVGADPSIGARVTKEPLGGGRYQIVVSVFCDNIFGCVPDAIDASLDFNRAVSAARP